MVIAQIISSATKRIISVSNFNEPTAQNGKSNYLDLDNVDGESSLAFAESSLAASNAELTQDQMALFLALGGGWQQ